MKTFDEVWCAKYPRRDDTAEQERAPLGALSLEVQDVDAFRRDMRECAWFMDAMSDFAHAVFGELVKALRDGDCPHCTIKAALVTVAAMLVGVGVEMERRDD